MDVCHPVTDTTTTTRIAIGIKRTTKTRMELPGCNVIKKWTAHTHAHADADDVHMQMHTIRTDAAFR
uniref:Uncharacterized protein n=1 Tax=Setaria digitata TaxID=48799 RepID=A0A915PKG4_9BILA